MIESILYNDSRSDLNPCGCMDRPRCVNHYSTTTQDTGATIDFRDGIFSFISTSRSQRRSDQDQLADVLVQVGRGGLQRPSQNGRRGAARPGADDPNADLVGAARVQSTGSERSES